MISETYMLATKRVPEMMAAIQDAGVPPKFTNEFIRSIGFKSTNDRGFISVLKGIGFLEENGVPTDAYRQYKDKTRSKHILAIQLRKHYEDVFLANEKANELSTEKIEGIFSAKTGKGKAVVTKMALTFKALSSLADFSGRDKNEELGSANSEKNDEPEERKNSFQKKVTADFRYNIEIHLPITKDISVYNSIFKSMREHLL